MNKSAAIAAVLNFVLLAGHALAQDDQTISHYQQLSQALGAVTAKKLAASPLYDNIMRDGRR